MMSLRNINRSLAVLSTTGRPFVRTPLQQYSKFQANNINMSEKRKNSAIVSRNNHKKARALSVSSEDSSDEKWLNWPASVEQMEAGREFIRECVRDQHLVLLVPDKDADGLSSGKIMHNTLTALGHPTERLEVHMLGKCASIFQAEERKRIEAYGATRVIVMDQGSRGGPPLVSQTLSSGEPVRTLIIDHHESESFPEGALVVSACQSPPISTSSLLTYLLCLPFLSSNSSLLAKDPGKIREESAIFALLGVYGDLGSSAVKWGEGPWPAHLGDVAKKVTKKALTEAVSMMNAPRRTAEYQVDEAWKAILDSHTPQDISTNPSFLRARAQVNAEVERCTHAAPSFSRDGRVALLRISSAYQIHPVIATRWAGHLKTRNLQMIMCANNAHHPSGEFTSFSCRMPAALRRLPEGERPDLIGMLREYAEKVPRDEEGRTFVERVGGDFARGHKEATGGIILTSEFEDFAEAMEIGIKPDKLPSNDSNHKSSRRGATLDTTQNTKITSYFTSSPTKSTQFREP